MIVDLLRNDLSKHCQPGSINVPELFKLESFAAVHHLVSTVTGKLKIDSSAIDLLQGAFPGGSITGAPKIRAMQIIDELEPNNRNIYCGSIGYIGLFGDMDTNICIRTLLCEKSLEKSCECEETPKISNNQQTMHCWAGGGIVLDSNAKDEYQESLDKVSKILPVLSSGPTLSKLG
jgi:para-aminobenzoate synthetase component 1